MAGDQFRLRVSVGEDIAKIIVRARTAALARCALVLV